MRYKAFISYSHVLDSTIAPALQSALQSIAKPWYARRAMNVFRDTTNLSVSPAMWPKIEQALAESEYLLLLASPKATQSRWVAKEVDWWLKNKKAENVLLILTDGTIVWDNTSNEFDWSLSTALPEALRGTFSSEPLYANFSGFRGSKLTLANKRFGDQVAMIAATLLSKSKDEIYGDDLRQHNRTKRIYQFGVASLSVLSTVAITAGIWAFMLSISEKMQRDIAVGEAGWAKQQAREAFKASQILATDVAWAAMERNRPTEAMHSFARAVYFAERRPMDNQESKQRVELELIRDSKPWWVAAGTPGEALLKVSSPERYRLGALAQRAYGLKLIRSQSRSDVQSDFLNDKTRSLSTNQHLLWDLKTADQIRKLKDTGKWPAATFEDGRQIFLEGKIAIVTPASAAVLEEFLKEEHELSTAKSKQQQAPRPVRLMGHEEDVCAAAFDPDGGRVATSSWDHTCRIWNSATGDEITKLTGHSKCVAHVEFIHGGKSLMTCSDDGTARIWDLSTGSSVEFSGHAGPVLSAAISDDGERMITASADRSARIWELKQGRSESEVVLKGHDDKVVYACFSHNGRRALTVSVDRVVRVWNSASGELIADLVGSDCGIFSAEYSSDDRFVTASSWNGEQRTWQASFRDPIGFPAMGNPSRNGSISGCAGFDGSGTSVVAVSTMQPIRVWNLPKPDDGPMSPISFGSSDQLSQFAQLSPDGKVVAAADRGTFSRWNRETGESLGPAVRLKFGIRDCFTFSPDSEWIAVPSDQQTQVQLFNMRDGRSVDIGPATGFVLSIAFSRDGKQLATGSNDQIARIWPNPVMGEKIATERTGPSLFEGHDDGITAVSFNPDGSRFVTASRDKTARVWNVDSRKTTAVLIGHSGPLNDARFSTDGSLIVTASTDDTARVWSADDGQVIAILRHDKDVSTAAFHPNATPPWILSATIDGQVRLWPLQAAPGHHEYLSEWVKVFTGTILENGLLRGLDEQEWKALRMNLAGYRESLPGAPGLQVP